MSPGIIEIISHQTKISYLLQTVEAVLIFEEASMAPPLFAEESSSIRDWCSFQDSLHTFRRTSPTQQKHTVETPELCSCTSPGRNTLFSWIHEVLPWVSCTSLFCAPEVPYIDPWQEHCSRVLAFTAFTAPPAAAAKLLQSCPTLYDPIYGSPPGSSVPGTLQARIPEWVAISFSITSPPPPPKTRSQARTVSYTGLPLPHCQSPVTGDTGMLTKWDPTPLFSPEACYHHPLDQSL